MNPSNHPHRDVLLSRIVDREDRPADWKRFDVLKDADADLARDLIDALRSDATLRAAVGSVLDRADRVVVPSEEPGASALSVLPQEELREPSAVGGARGGDARRSERWRAASHWMGWLAAAVLLLCWMANDPGWKRQPDLIPESESQQMAAGTGGRPDGHPDGSDRGPGEQFGPRQAPLKARAASSEMLRRLPNVLVETRPIPDSDRVEVVFVRRSVERAVVSNLYSIGRDESGIPFEARVDLTRFTNSQNH